MTNLRARGISRPLMLSLAGALLGLSAARADSWTSTDGLYQLDFESEIEPLAINRLHRWTVTLTDRDGNPVVSADIEVTGGMPEHNHGLPTVPQVTGELGDGRYVLEGMRFHMQGYWELVFAIDSALGKDTVIVDITIDR